jgi:hypothetical protein
VLAIDAVEPPVEVIKLAQNRANVVGAHRTLLGAASSMV